MKFFYNKEGSFTNASTVMDENGNETDSANNPDYQSMTIKKVKEKEYNRFIKKNPKEKKKNLFSPMRIIPEIFPNTFYFSSAFIHRKIPFIIINYKV